MDWLTLYGLVSVGAMMLFYALEGRSHWFVLAFAVTCVMSSIYGFLQGAWPFGLVELVWSGVAVKRWQLLRAKAFRDIEMMPDRDLSAECKAFVPVEDIYCLTRSAQSGSAAPK